MISALFFWIFAFTACMFAIGVVIARNPMHSALSLVATFVSLAGIFLQLHAEFLAWILIIVYTGAVMVLIIFVVSLLNLQKDEPIDFTTARRWAISLVGVFLITFLIYLFRDPIFGFIGPDHFGPSKPEVPPEWGSAAVVAEYMFTRYVLPFELASVLLTAAVIGAVVIARRSPEEREEEKR